MDDFKAKTNSFLRFIAGARLFAWVLPWLMIILVVGTIAQKNLGLYAAQQRYFASWIIWLWDVVPLPGLLPTAIVIFVGLAGRLALEQWRWQNLGTIVIHIGAALLLFGSFVTSIVSREGVMIIPQNETRDYIEDLRHVELAVAELRDRKIVQEHVTAENKLAAGDFNQSSLPFRIIPVAWCRNCALRRLPSAVTTGDPHGVAINFVLDDKPPAPDAENNRAGLTFRLQGTNGSDGLYAIFQDMPIREIVTVGTTRYWITLRPARAALPFALRLRQFREELYPGTNKPRAYQSDVTVDDGGIVWPAIIRMNEPLRYKGYTFYQSSFMQGDGHATTTILAVVKNAGRLFPYLSSVLLAAGFVIHLVQRLVLQARKRRP